VQALLAAFQCGLKNASWSLFGNPLKALETAMLGKFGKASSLVEAWPPANQALGSHKERRFD